MIMEHAVRAAVSCPRFDVRASESLFRMVGGLSGSKVGLDQIFLLSAK